MQRFDKNAVRALLTEVVRKRGEDYVYPRNDRPRLVCSYQFEGKGDCGLGLMLSDIGVSQPVLASMDAITWGSEIDSPDIMDILRRAGFEFTQGARDYMRKFQEMQDSEYPYGKCLAAAEHKWAPPVGDPPF